jgi:hypothetical protein
MKYHRISVYQFYITLKHVNEGIAPKFMHRNSNQEYLLVRTDMYIAWLGRICLELVEGLPTGFRLEFAKRVFLKSYFEI